MSITQLCPNCKKTTEHSDVGYLMMGRHVLRCQSCKEPWESGMTAKKIKKDDPIRRLLK